MLQKRGTDSDINIISKLFDIVTPQFRANDGEVLQITRDRMLAVFPEYAEARAGGYMCPIATQNAYTAAIGADKATLDGDLPASLGFGLSYGPVGYGNVGAEDRLAFTVISAGVNRADQPQSLCPLGIRMWLFRAIAPRISRMGRCGLLVIAYSRVSPRKQRFS